MSSFECLLPSVAAGNTYGACAGFADSGARAAMVVINIACDIDKVKIPLDFFADLADHVVNKFGARVVLVAMNVAENTDRVELEAAA